MTQVISGFPGVGKTSFVMNSDLDCLDSDSSNFSWSGKGVRNPDFPLNYIHHIKSNIGKVDYILVSSHDVVREALQEHGIKYTLVYPSITLLEEYINRYTRRGSHESFIQLMQENWNTFITSIESETFPRLIRLEAGQFLSDVL